jgi:hypothetical protein
LNLSITYSLEFLELNCRNGPTIVPVFEAGFFQFFWRYWLQVLAVLPAISVDAEVKAASQRLRAESEAEAQRIQT